MSGTIPWERVRRAGSKLTTPLLPDDYLHLLNPLWSSRELRGRVEEVVPETEDAATLVIRPGWGWRFDHRPGQYVGIGVQVDGKFQWRSYSVSSPPKRDGRTISITVRAMPEAFSRAYRWFHNAMVTVLGRSRSTCNTARSITAPMSAGSRRRCIGRANSRNRVMSELVRSTSDEI